MSKSATETKMTEAKTEAKPAVATKGTSFPSLFAMSPKDFFSANPFEMMRKFSEEMDKAFEGFGSGKSSLLSEAKWTPAIEVFEKDGKLSVHAELPGMTKDDIKVELVDQGLVVRGERKQSHKEEGKNLYRSEMSYGQFYRYIPLPEGTEVDKAEATFNNGVLEIAIPIPAKPATNRTIEIK